MKEIIEAEKAWAIAHLEGDVEALDRLMHPDYAIVRPDGSVIGKEEALRDYQLGVRRWERAESDDYLIRVYGDTAVVVGRWIACSVNRGERFDYQARYTSVWVKEGGYWRMVSDQSTEIGG